MHSMDSCDLNYTRKEYCVEIKYTVEYEQCGLCQTQNNIIENKLEKFRIEK